MPDAGLPTLHAPTVEQEAVSHALAASAALLVFHN